MITIQLPTEPIYWGSTVTENDVTRILDSLESMIRSEYADAPFELRFERTATPQGCGIHGDDQDAVECVREFIAANWTQAL